MVTVAYQLVIELVAVEMMVVVKRVARKMVGRDAEEECLDKWKWPCPHLLSHHHEELDFQPQ